MTTSGSPSPPGTPPSARSTPSSWPSSWSAAAAAASSCSRSNRWARRDELLRCSLGRLTEPVVNLLLNTHGQLLTQRWGLKRRTGTSVSALGHVYNSLVSKALISLCHFHSVKMLQINFIHLDPCRIEFFAHTQWCAWFTKITKMS